MTQVTMPRRRPATRQRDRTPNHIKHVRCSIWLGASLPALGERRVPPRAGNLIRTHLSKGGPKQTTKFGRTAGNTVDDTIRRAQHPLHPCRTLLREIRQRLGIVSSHVLVACATLNGQRADRDCDVSAVLHHSVGDEITRLVELLDSLLDDPLLKGDAP